MDFTKENTALRMLRRSAELWGYDETQLDQFDPLVKMLIGACAVEFEKVGQKIQQTELRLMTRLAEILSPETTRRVLPATAIATARSLDAISWVDPENQLVFRRSSVRKNENPEMYFAPAGRFPVVNAGISCLATPAGLYQADNGARNLLSPALRRNAGAQDVWLGIEIGPEVLSWENFRFYFDWSNDAAEWHYRDFLPLTSWTCNDVPLHLSAGSGQDSTGDTSWYESGFMHMTGQAKLEKVQHAAHFYPLVFELLYDRQSLQMMKKELVWFRISWPEAFPLKGFEHLQVVLNAFPVHNKQLHRLAYRLQPGLNGIALTSADAFAGVHAVLNQKNQQYTPSHQRDYGGMNSQELVYTLREQGVGRFDARDARAMLYQLSEMLKDEVTAFSALGDDFLAAILRDISQQLARIDQKLGPKKASETGVQPFLVIRGDKDPGVLAVSYWTSMGGAANGVPAGARLQAYAASGLNAAGMYLVTRTTGGKAAPEETEYVDQLRNNMVTRDRLVTREDIKAFCQAELGDQLVSVEVSTGYEPGHLPGQGFIKCLHIALRAASMLADGELWQQQCGKLQLKIAERSAGMYPVRVLSA
ncbi:hypothetical protein [Dyadobacter sandarakinus]|nr:hypothetical protein [Dyadobacter sandarakinus]